jgi:hypothetical protein
MDDGTTKHAVATENHREQISNHQVLLPRVLRDSTNLPDSSFPTDSSMEPYIKESAFCPNEAIDVVVKQKPTTHARTECNFKLSSTTSRSNEVSSMSRPHWSTRMIPRDLKFPFGLMGDHARNLATSIQRSGCGKKRTFSASPVTDSGRFVMSAQRNASFGITETGKNTDVGTTTSLALAS